MKYVLSGPFPCPLVSLIWEFENRNQKEAQDHLVWWEWGWEERWLPEQVCSWGFQAQLPSAKGNWERAFGRGHSPSMEKWNLYAVSMFKVGGNGGGVGK